MHDAWKWNWLFTHYIYACADINKYVQFKIRIIQYDLNNLDIRRYIRIVQVRGVFFLICLDVTKFPLVMRVSYCSKLFHIIHSYLFTSIQIAPAQPMQKQWTFSLKKHFTIFLKPKKDINKNQKLHDKSRCSICYLDKHGILLS